MTNKDFTVPYPSFYNIPVDSNDLKELNQQFVQLSKNQLELEQQHINLIMKLFHNPSAETEDEIEQLEENINHLTLELNKVSKQIGKINSAPFCRLNSHHCECEKELYLKALYETIELINRDSIQAEQRAIALTFVEACTSTIYNCLDDINQLKDRRNDPQPLSDAELAVLEAPSSDYFKKFAEIYTSIADKALQLSKTKDFDNQLKKNTKRYQDRLKSLQNKIKEGTNLKQQLIEATKLSFLITIFHQSDSKTTLLSMTNELTNIFYDRCVNYPKTTNPTTIAKLSTAMHALTEKLNALDDEDDHTFALEL